MPYLKRTGVGIANMKSGEIRLQRVALRMTLEATKGHADSFSHYVIEEMKTRWKSQRLRLPIHRDFKLESGSYSYDGHLDNAYSVRS